MTGLFIFVAGVVVGIAATFAFIVWAARKVIIP